MMFELATIFIHVKNLHVLPPAYLMAWSSGQHSGNTKQEPQAEHDIGREAIVDFASI
jgi:hypothetical protein